MILMTKKLFLRFGLFAFALSVSEGVLARSGSMSGVILGADISYVEKKGESKVDTGSATAKVNYTEYDLGLGYVTAIGMYIGGLYSSQSIKDDDSTVTGSAYGPSLGLLFGPGFSITGTYLLSGTLGQYKEGTGIQADLGWRSELGRGFFLGAKLSYRSIDYKKNEDLPTLVSYKITDLKPYISMGFLF